MKKFKKNFIFYRPLYWPIPIWIIIILMFELTMVFSIGRHHLQNNADILNLNQEIKSRAQEILTLKASGIEPYLWQPLLKCHYPTRQLQKDCLQIAFHFKKYDGQTLNKVERREASFGFIWQYIHRPEKSCLICHRNAQKLVVEWNLPISFASENEIDKKLAISSLNQSFLIANLFMLLGLIIFFVIKKIVKIKGGLNLTTFVINFASINDIEDFKIKKMVSKLGFLYYERDKHGLRGFVPNYLWTSFLKKAFTAYCEQSPKTNFHLKVVAMSSKVLEHPMRHDAELKKVLMLLTRFREDGIYIEEKLYAECLSEFLLDNNKALHLKNKKGQIITSFKYFKEKNYHERS